MEKIKKHSDKELAVSNPDTIINIEQLLREKEMHENIIANHENIITSEQTALDRVNFLLGEAKKLNIN